MTVDLAAITYGLKRHYAKGKVQNLAMRDKPALGLIRRETRAGGEAIKCPLRFRNSVGGSASYANALSNYSEHEGDAFILDWKDHFQFAKIDDKAMTLSNTADAFLKARVEIDHAVDMAAESRAAQLYREEGGYIGQLSNSTTTTTIGTLSDSGDGQHFHKNQVLTLSANSDGSSVKSGTLTVSSVSRGGTGGTSTVTFTTLIDSGVATAAVGDYIFKQGDEGNALLGFKSYIPDAAPSDTLYSVDRSADSVRLGGHRIDASSMPIREALIKIGADLVADGAKPDYCFMNPSKYAELEISLHSQLAVPVTVKSRNGLIGYDGIKVACGGRHVVVLPDWACPTNRAYMVQSDTFCFFTPKSDILWLKGADGSGDGSILHRAEASNDWIGQVISYMEVGCMAPGYNAVLKFS